MLIFRYQTAKEFPNFLRGTKRFKLPFMLIAHRIENGLLLHVRNRRLVEDFWRRFIRYRVGRGK